MRVEMLVAILAHSIGPLHFSAFVAGAPACFLLDLHFAVELDYIFCLTYSASMAQLALPSKEVITAKQLDENFVNLCKFAGMADKHIMDFAKLLGVEGEMEALAAVNPASWLP